jgi:LPXTG-motif cell wall-anchored protein
VSSTGAVGTSGTASGNTPAAQNQNNRANQSDRGANAGSSAAAGRTLPQTASPIGWLAVLSGLALSGAAGVAQMRRRLRTNR